MEAITAENLGNAITDANCQHRGGQKRRRDRVEIIESGERGVVYPPEVQHESKGCTKKDI
jgi:hypothetical protein